jgi:hypothetical protein
MTNGQIGVIQKRVPESKSPRTIAALDAFASQIARAYLPSRHTISRAELALAYGVPEAFENHQHAHMEISSSVSFHEHFSFVSRRASARRESAAAAQVRPGFGEAQAMALFERLFSRRKRIAEFSDSTPQRRTPPRDLTATRSLAPDFPAAPAERVHRILPRLARAEHPEADAHSEKRSETGWGSPVTPPASPKPITLPPAEVKRVTDEVIRAIDHRIIARRERMGRR